MDTETEMNAEAEREAAQKKSVMFAQLRCLVALYVGYLGISLGKDIFTAQVSGTLVWVCGAAAVVFVGAAAAILVRDLSKALKRSK